MKNNFKKSGSYIILSLIIITSFFILTNISNAESKLEDRLVGRILLQVEENGESWYVSPQTKERIFLGRPADAFSIMRKEGIGISNANLERIPIGTWHNVMVDSDDDMLSDNFEDAIGTNKYKRDSDDDGYEDYTEIITNNNPSGIGSLNIDKNYARAHAGKIFLAVERNGEAWYIDPEDNKRYFLGRPDDAFSLMRKKGLGIINNDLNQIKKRVQNKDVDIDDKIENDAILHIKEENIAIIIGSHEKRVVGNKEAIFFGPQVDSHMSQDEKRYAYQLEIVNKKSVDEIITSLNQSDIEIAYIKIKTINNYKVVEWVEPGIGEASFVEVSGDNLNLLFFSDGTVFNSEDDILYFEDVIKNIKKKNIVKIDENWNKYINYDLGFSINYPTQNYLGKEVEIIEDENLVYILTGDSFVEKEIEEKKNSSIYEKASGIPYAILIEDVSNEEELEEFIQNRYGANCLLGEMGETAESEVYKVSIDSSNWSPTDPEGCFINYGLSIRYDKENGKVAAWDMGQAVNFMVNDASVDNQINESFRFLR